MNFFVKDFFDTAQARVVIFGKQVDSDELYRVIANQPAHAYSSLFLSDFLSFHTLNTDNDVLYRRIANQPSHAYSSLY